MGINTAAGAKLYIGTTMAAATIAEFEEDYFIEVGEVEDLGEFGDESESVEFASLSDNRMRKLKGVRDAGTMDVVCGADASDAGQADMVAAEASALDFNFRVILNDRLTLSGTGTHAYFRGKVMSKRRQVGTANDVLRYNFSVGINTEILEEPAT